MSVLPDTNGTVPDARPVRLVTRFAHDPEGPSCHTVSAWLDALFVNATDSAPPSRR